MMSESGLDQHPEFQEKFRSHPNVQAVVHIDVKVRFGQTFAGFERGQSLAVFVFRDDSFEIQIFEAGILVGVVLPTAVLLDEFSFLHRMHGLNTIEPDEAQDDKNNTTGSSHVGGPP